ncbi:hypothetical protein TNCV_2600371 [Trichonephila clavipes]|nr:hypothetical protein TNCV_2600371 [Trichonephila clavipes]
MSTEAMTIPAVRSSTKATGVSHTGDFRCPQKKKSIRLRSRERGGQATGSPSPIHLLGMYQVRDYESKNVLAFWQYMCVPPSHSFAHSPRLGHHSPDVHYYREFHPIRVCDPIFNDDLSASCCLSLLRICRIRQYPVHPSIKLECNGEYVIAVM